MSNLKKEKNFTIFFYLFKCLYSFVVGAAVYSHRFIFRPEYFRMHMREEKKEKIKLMHRIF